MASEKTYILFELAGTAYAVPSAVVQRMEMVDQVTPVPNAPSYVEGIVFSRRRVVPAVNLRRRFGFEPASHDEQTRLIVVNHGERTVGLVVDTAREFMAIPSEAIQAPPESMGGTSGNYLSGIATIGNRLVLIIDVAGVLDHATNRLPDAPSPD